MGGYQILQNFNFVIQPQLFLRIDEALFDFLYCSMFTCSLVLSDIHRAKSAYHYKFRQDFKRGEPSPIGTS